MFGESYPNPVRVVSVGADLEQVLLVRPIFLILLIYFLG